MNIKLKRFDKSIPFPAYQSKTAACVDLHARIEITIPPHSFGKIPLNIALELPPNTWMMLAARSSTHKTGLIPANGIGIFDHDFCDDNDEYLFLVYNVSEEPVVVKKGQRMAQMMAISLEPMKIEEVESLGNVDRGGVGSTGN
jgi:dUTP pyrophosphatase